MGIALEFMKQDDSQSKTEPKECEVCGKVVSDHYSRHANSNLHKKFEKMSPDERVAAIALRNKRAEQRN